MKKYYCDICKKEFKENDLFPIKLPAYHCYNAECNGKILKKHIMKIPIMSTLEICKDCCKNIAEQLYQKDIFI